MAMTRLQLAIDLVPLADLEAVIAPLLPYIDVVEAGTPLIKRHGMEAVRVLRRLAPDHLVVADMKAMDAGGLEAEIAFEAGADIMTVLAGASDATITAAIAIARERGKAVVGDLIGVADKVGRANQVASLGISYIGIHTGTDDQATGMDPLSDLAAISRAVEIETVVAGGIIAATLPAILALRPAIVIVGTGILGQPDPIAAAKALRDIIDRELPA
jgi:3-hexulose-6-phosphate synthase